MDNTKRNQNYLLNFFSLSAHRNAIYGFAALWIVCFHYVDMGKKIAGFPPKLQFLWDSFQMGNIGVDIFLFLSGVGLYYSFSKDGRILRFYWKRFVRIIVPYYLLCVPYFAYLTITGDFSVAKFFRFATTVFYWVGDTARLNLWYVPAILVLYLAYPLIYRFLFCSEKGVFLRCALLTGLSVLLTASLWYFDRDGIYQMYDKFLPRVAVFIVGCGCGKPVKEKKDFSAWVIPAALLIVFFAYPLYTRAILTGAMQRYYGGLTAVAIVFLLAQLFEVIQSIPLEKFFAFFGAMSLEIYLLHVEARYWYKHSSYFGSHPLRWYSLLAAGSLILAYLASLIEKPICRLLLKPLDKNKEPQKNES